MHDRIVATRTSNENHLGVRSKHLEEPLLVLPHRKRLALGEDLVVSCGVWRACERVYGAPCRGSKLEIMVELQHFF